MLSFIVVYVSGIKSSENLSNHLYYQRKFEFIKTFRVSAVQTGAKEELGKISLEIQLILVCFILSLEEIDFV